MTWQPGSCGRASRGYVTANGRCANGNVDQPLLLSEQVRLLEEAARLALSQTAKPGLRILAPLAVPHGKRNVSLAVVGHRAAASDAVLPRKLTALGTMARGVAERGRG